MYIGKYSLEFLANFYNGIRCNNCPCRQTRVISITRLNVFRTNMKCAAGWRSCDAAQWSARILLDWSVKHNNKNEETIRRYTGVWYANIFGLFILAVPSQMSSTMVMMSDHLYIYVYRYIGSCIEVFILLHRRNSKYFCIFENLMYLITIRKISEFSPIFEIS